MCAHPGRAPEAVLSEALVRNPLETSAGRCGLGFPGVGSGPGKKSLFPDVTLSVSD